VKKDAVALCVPFVAFHNISLLLCSTYCSTHTQVFNNQLAAFMSDHGITTETVSMPGS
jgi:hypothetical protein